MENSNYYGILPANVRYDKNLKPMEKIMYTELTALSNKNGFCNAQNAYFAKLYDVHKNTVGAWINKLEKSGYIRTKLIYAKDKEGESTKEIIERKIWIIQNPVKINSGNCQEKDYKTANKKTETPVNEKTEENNTSNEYYKNNNNSSSNNINNNIYKNQNETYRTKEIENKWRETGLKEYEYPPVVEISGAIKVFNIAKIFCAIERLGRSRFWKNRLGIDRFFDPSYNYREIRNILNGERDDFEEEEGEPQEQVLETQEELEKRMQESDDHFFEKAYERVKGTQEELEK